jgi:fructokinase
MAATIYFCGEVVADLLEYNQGSGDFKLLLGGSQFHGAMGATKAVERDKADIQVGFIGPISKDMFGDRFIAQLKTRNVDISGAPRVDRNTTLAIVSICPGKENAFSFYGRDTAEQMTKIEDLPTTLTPKDQNKICCFGSISTVMEPARFAWLAFAKAQRDSGIVIYDLNTRPSIAKDPERYRSLVLEWAQTAHVVKASDADIAWAYPGKSMKEIARIWHEAGASLAVFTKGMHGSEAYASNGTSAFEETLDLVATNTVGAGDNFNAGLAIQLASKRCFSRAALESLSEKDLSAILKGANETAAYHLISIGAKPRGQSPNPSL